MFYPNIEDFNLKKQIVEHQGAKWPVEHVSSMSLGCYYSSIGTERYKDRVTNEGVRAKIQQAIGPHSDLLTIVKRRKLQGYRHVSRSSGLTKTILHGTAKGRRRQGRQRKTTAANGQAWSSPSLRGQWRTGKSGRNWL